MHAATDGPEANTFWQQYVTIILLCDITCALVWISVLNGNGCIVFNFITFHFFQDVHVIGALDGHHICTCGGGRMVTAYPSLSSIVRIDTVLTSDNYDYYRRKNVGKRSPYDAFAS